MTLLHDCLLLKFAGLCLIDKGAMHKKYSSQHPILMVRKNKIKNK